MPLLVLGGVVGVHRVRHVGAEHKRLGDGGGVRVAVRLAEGRRDSLHRLAHDRRARAHRAAAANFLVVEASHEADVCVGGRGFGRRVFDERFDGKQARDQVVEPRLPISRSLAVN